MSIADEISRLSTAKNSIGSSLNRLGVATENGDRLDDYADDLAAYVKSSQSSSTGVTAAKSVNFRDYDGTLLHSYTLEEAQSLTELPIGGSHAGLLFQGWNWTLDEIKAFGRAAEVGANYITDDGKTRYYISLPNIARPTVYVGFTLTGSNADDCEIDWGDGTIEYSTTIGNACYTHDYTAAGDYVITLEPKNGATISLVGQTSSSGYHAFGNITNGNKTNGTANILQKIEIGSSVTSIGNNAFRCCSSLSSIAIPSGVTDISPAFATCSSLSSIIIPSGVTSIGNSAFASCSSLSSIIIPFSVTSIGNSAFANCPPLPSITIPSSVTSIGNSTFQYCYSLSSITIPSSVTNIGSYAFQNCYYMAEYHFLPTTPPTIGTDAFQNIPSDCIIYVPAGCLEAYQTAENWSTYADYMKEEA